VGFAQRKRNSAQEAQHTILSSQGNTAFVRDLDGELLEITDKK
jgi:hypothetical protein